MMAHRNYLYLGALAAYCSSLGCGAKPPPIAKQSAAPPVAVKKEEAKAIPETPPPAIAAVSDFTNAAAALEVLKTAFTTPASRERDAQVSACQSWLAKHADQAVEPVAKIAHDTAASPELRLSACLILSQYGEAGLADLCALAEKCDQLIVRRRAIDRLGQLKPPPAVAIKTLIQLLEAKETEVLVPTLNVLAKIGEPAAEAGNKLADLRKNHAEEIVRTAAGDALKRVNPRRTFQD